MSVVVSIGKNTKVEVGSVAKVSVGGDMANYGDLNVHNGGELNVARNILNAGKMSVDDPVMVKDIVLEAIRTAKTYAELGKIIAEKLGLMN